MKSFISRYKIITGIFFYIILVSVFFQKIVLTHMPSMSVGNGLLKGDNALFHDLAVSMASDIKINGWTHWKVFPNNNVTAGINVGFVAIIYYFFGANPLFVLPLNALIHTCSAFFLMKIVRAMGGDRIAEIISAVLFSVFPVTLIWVAQLHKDSYAILAWFIFFYSLLKLNYAHEYRKAAYGTLSSFLIFCLIRPQYLALVAVVLIGNVIFQMRNHFMLIKEKGNIFLVICGAGVLITLLIFFSDQHKHYEYRGTLKVKKEEVQNCSNYEWTPTSYFSILDSKFQTLAGIRVGQLCAGIKSNSLIDKDYLPGNVNEVLIYLPRALQVGLLYPTPIFLVKLNGGIMSWLALGEMCIYYFFLVFIFYSMLTKRMNGEKWMLLFSSIACTTLFGIIFPNIGSLHRVKYPFLMIIISIGVIGLESFVKSRKEIQHA